MSDLAAENAKLKAKIADLEKQLAEKTTTLENIKKGAAALAAAIKQRHAQGLPIGKGEALKDVAESHGQAVAKVLEQHDIHDAVTAAAPAVVPQVSARSVPATTSQDDESPWLTSGPKLSQANVDAAIKESGATGVPVEASTFVGDDSAADVVCVEPSSNGLYPGICGYPKNNHNFRHPFKPGKAPGRGSVQSSTRSVPQTTQTTQDEDESPWLTSGPKLAQSNIDAAIKESGATGVPVEFSSISGDANTVCHEPSSNGKYPGICGYPKSNHNFRHTYKPGPIPTSSSNMDVEDD